MTNVKLEVSDHFGNVVFSTDAYYSELRHFGNRIAEYRDGVLRITTADRNCCVQTRQKLNKLPGVRVKKSKGVLYLNDSAWDGTWVEVPGVTLHYSCLNNLPL